MKKTLAVILSVLMIICCIPLSAGAASRVEITGVREIESSSWMVSDTNYVVVSGAVLVVPSHMTAYVPADCELVISEGATLRCYGQIVVLAGGSLRVEGLIEGDGASHILTQDGGSATATVRFPSDDALDKANLTGKIKVSYGVTSNGNSYEDIEAEGTEKNFWHELGEDRAIDCALNQYVHVKVEISEENNIPYDKYDDSQMTVYVNGVGNSLWTWLKQLPSFNCC